MSRLRKFKDKEIVGPRLQKALSTTESRRWMRPVAMAMALSLGLPPIVPSAQTANAPATKEKSEAESDSVWLNMPDTDLEAVVRAIGQYTGRAFVIDPRVKGNLTLVTEHAVTKRQAYELLLSALRLQGFTVVEAGNVARILPEADAKLQGSRVIAPPSKPPRGDQVVTQVFRLQYESVTNLVPILRPLIPPNNTISAYPANNSLVITDYADNLRRIQDIISVLDTSLGAEPVIIALKHGLAVEIGAIANQILDEGARAAGQATDAGQRVQVLAEPRTNSLIVRAASPARLLLARKIIDQLDQPSTTPGNINVVYLRNAEATKLAPLLRAIVAGDPSYVPTSDGSSGLSDPSGQIAASSQGQAITGAGGGNQALGGMIQADASTNSLIITAPPPLYQSLRTTIEKLDVRRAQVMIETLIVEVSTDKAAELGVQFQALGGLREGEGNNTHVIGGTNFGGGGQNIIGAAQNLGTLGGGLNVGVIRGTVTIPGIGEVTNLGFLARALESSASANVLSRPNIQVLDNEEAKFLVGQNVPFVTGSFTQGQSSGATNPFQTFERRDVGLQLRVKPQVSEGGAVKLAIYVEISSVQPGTVSGQLITNKRSFESSVIVEDGNFVVLSGLIEDKGNDGVSKVPLLGDIPVLGALFRYENRSRTKTNTMVFLKPNVVRDEQASSSLAADRYDFIRQKLSTTGRRNTFIFRDYQSDGLPPLPAAAQPASDRPELGPDDGQPGQTPQPSETDASGEPRSSHAALPEAATVLTVDGLQAPVEPEPIKKPEAEALSYAPPQPLAPPKETIEVAQPVNISLPKPTPTAPSAPTPVAKEEAAVETAPEPEKLALAQPVEEVSEAPQQPETPSPTSAAKAQRPQVPKTQGVKAQKATPSAAVAPTKEIHTPAQPVAPIASTEPTKVSASIGAKASTPESAPAAAQTAAPQAAAVPEATPAPASVAARGPQLIQVANVKTIVKGRQLQRKLNAAGLDAYWESVRERTDTASQTPQDVVRVRVLVDGAAQSVSEALTLLKQLGFEPVVVQP